MDPVTASWIGEAIKLAIQQIVILANSAGKTPEQVQAEIVVEWEKFQANKPEDLPNV